MKTFATFCLSICGLLFLSSPADPQSGAKPYRPGVREDEKHVTKIVDEAPLVERGKVDYVQVQRDADELARLAQSIPPDIENTAKGLLPKDVIERLKRIEKLSKQLRSQLSLQ